MDKVKYEIVYADEVLIDGRYVQRDNQFIVYMYEDKQRVYLKSFKTFGDAEHYIRCMCNMNRLRYCYDENGKEIYVWWI